MTDQFKDKNKSDSKAVRSFKEQILADLEEAHRLRQLKEESFLPKEKEADSSKATELEEAVSTANDSSLDEAGKERLLTALEEAHRLNQLSRTINDYEQAYKEEVEEEKKRNVKPLDKVPHSERLSSSDDLRTDSQLVVEESLPENVEGTDFDLERLGPSSSEEDLDVTRVMAGFEELFSPERVRADGENQNSVSFSSDDADNNHRGFEATQEFDTKDFINTAVAEETRSAKHRRTNRVARKISLALLSILTILIVVTGFFVYRYIDSGIKPLDAKATDYIQVEIPSGSGNKLIGKVLEDAGVIKSGQIFNYYAKFKNYTNFKSGFYNLQKSMSLDDIAKKLQEGGTDTPERPILGKILIPEGYTLEQIAKAVALNANTADKKDKTPFSEAEFMTLVQDEAFIARMVEKFPSLLGSLPNATEVRYRLEGYLYPATYSYYAETNLESIIEQMLAAMEANLSPLYASISENGMTVNQVLTLASLVEKEGKTDDDRKLIAGVFYNRWNQGMPLQSNIAILYAMGKLGQATTLLEDATIDTAIDSAYNIYVNKGLMPGPVDSPSIAAIKATVNPQQSNYLYFVADVTTGVVYYSESYEEHLANVEKYVNSHLVNNN